MDEREKEEEEEDFFKNLNYIYSLKNYLFIQQIQQISGLNLYFECFSKIFKKLLSSSVVLLVEDKKTSLIVLTV